MATGWTWDYIRNELDLNIVEQLNLYWKKVPPLHVSMAAFIGYKPKNDAATEAEAPSIAHLAQSFGGAGVYQPPCRMVS